MFIGHFALGFAAKRVAPRVSLPVLFGAAQLADLLWPVLVALGVEQVRIDPGNTAFTPLDFVRYPYSHSLVLLAIWGALAGLAYRRARGASGRVALLLFALVVSHWVLDYVTHRPDMPLYPGGPKVGLGLWNSIPATLIVELAMFAAGAWIYARATRARTKGGRRAYVIFVVFLLALYAANVAGPPPPSVTAIWIAGLPGGILLLVWSWWVDRQRDVYLLPGRGGTGGG
jgi:membrane-bound metal-dependent hydrolase YbcI (DUF457 family)